MIWRTRITRPTSPRRTPLRCALIASRSRWSHRWRDWVRALRERFRSVIARRAAADMVYQRPMTLITHFTQYVEKRSSPSSLNLTVRPRFTTCISMASSASVNFAERTTRMHDRNRSERRPVRTWAALPASRLSQPRVDRDTTPMTIAPPRRVLSPPFLVDRARTTADAGSFDLTSERTRRRFMRHTRIETVATTDVHMQAVRVRQRAQSVVGAQVAEQIQQARRRQRRVEPLAGPRVDRTLRKTTPAAAGSAARGTAPAAAGPAARGTVPALSATASSTPPAMRRAEQPAPAAPQIDVQALTDRVVQQIDRRFIAWRERTGRA